MKLSYSRQVLRNMAVAMLASLTLTACVRDDPSDSSSRSGTGVYSNSDIYASADQYAYSSANGIGTVASVHPLATKAGIDALENGGNAIDAAVATALTLGVVDGHNSGIGGGNFAIIRYADGTLQALDGREMAPQAAYRDMYIRDGKADGSLSKTGALAIGVPGSLAVYDSMLKTGGKLTLAELLLPAADIAEQGFPLGGASHSRITATAEKMRSLSNSSDAAKILLDDRGQPWAAGHRLVQKDLANTYRLIAERGINYFYQGGFAKLVDEWMKANGGFIVFDDFANYQMLHREPVKTSYRGYEVYGFAPPSSGGIHVAQILNILENYDVSSLSDEDRYHLIAESMKLAFADRAHYLGDPDFTPVPKGLLDKSYARQLSKGISFEKAATDVEHGVPPGADIDLFGKHTTHISAADKYGNWVSITTTVNTSFGSKVIIPGTGVVMNNQMDDFSIQPGVPNAFGLVGKEANSVRPGKRPLSSMSPTILMRQGKPVMSVGAAGGPTIISQVVQGIVNVVDLNMSIEQALAAPRVHNQWQPEVTFVEKSLSENIKASLKQRGHKIHAREYLGATQMVMINHQGEFEAAAEPRVIERNKP